MVFQGRLKEKNTEFISSLFLEFNIQLSRTGFLLNRLSNFVQLDFQMMLRDQEEGSSLMKDPRFEQSLSYVVNMTAFNYISDLTGKAPGEYLSDLSLALNLSKNNLMLIERTFKDFFVGRIAELKVQSKTPQAGHQTLELDSMKRLWVDHLGAVPTERRESWAEWVADKVGGAIGMVITSIVGSDRYHAGGLSPWPAMGGGPSLWNWGTALSSDDEFESAKRMFSLYCIQALAFNDLRGVWHTCLNVKLESPFEAPQNSELKEAFEKYLNVDFKEQALRQLNENPGANASGRICALREFYRRNYSLYLTRNSTDGRSQEHQEDLEWEAEIHRKALDRAEEKRRNELEEQQRRQAATPVQREDPGKESKD
jgi:hypothetical protein